MPADTITESFTVPVSLERVLRVLRDPAVLSAAVAGTDAQAQIDRVLGTSRDVTIVFGDIEGFTPLSERLGDQGIADMLRTHERIVDNTLASHGGQRVKSMGDGFMAVFAEPAAALRSARRIQESLSALDRSSDGAPARARLGVAVRMRMGVHTGRVVPMRSANGARDLVGRSVVLASRIAGAATGGQVLVSAAVRQHTDPFREFRFLADRHLILKGLTGVHRVAELDWRATEPPSTHQQGTGGPT
jgi:class 3 adenylate cyclase